MIATAAERVLGLLRKPLDPQADRSASHAVASEEALRAVKLKDRRAVQAIQVL